MKNKTHFIIHAKKGL